MRRWNPSSLVAAAVVVLGTLVAGAARAQMTDAQAAFERDCEDAYAPDWTVEPVRACAQRHEVLYGGYGAGTDGVHWSFRQALAFTREGDVEGALRTYRGAIAWVRRAFGEELRFADVAPMLDGLVAMAELELGRGRGAEAATHLLEAVALESRMSAAARAGAPGHETSPRWLWSAVAELASRLQAAPPWLGAFALAGLMARKAGRSPPASQAGAAEVVAAVRRGLGSGGVLVEVVPVRPGVATLRDANLAGEAPERYVAMLLAADGRIEVVDAGERDGVSRAAFAYLERGITPSTPLLAALTPRLRGVKAVHLSGWDRLGDLPAAVLFGPEVAVTQVTSGLDLAAGAAAPAPAPASSRGCGCRLAGDLGAQAEWVWVALLTALWSVRRLGGGDESTA